MHDLLCLILHNLFVDHKRDDQESPFPHLGMALERNFGPGAGIRTSQSSNIKIPGAYPGGDVQLELIGVKLRVSTVSSSIP